MKFRIRRRCYDKSHRCPGWAGGGMRYAKVVVCEGGSLPHTYTWGRWLPERHAFCGTWALPVMAKWSDPSWLRYIFTDRKD